jgi:hypothetical protein
MVMGDIRTRCYGPAGDIEWVSPGEIKHWFMVSLIFELNQQMVKWLEHNASGLWTVIKTTSPMFNVDHRVAFEEEHDAIAFHFVFRTETK